MTFPSKGRSLYGINRGFDSPYRLITMWCGKTGLVVTCIKTTTILIEKPNKYDMQMYNEIEEIAARTLNILSTGLSFFKSECGFEATENMIRTWSPNSCPDSWEDFGIGDHVKCMLILRDDTKMHFVIESYTRWPSSVLPAENGVLICVDTHRQELLFRYWKGEDIANYKRQEIVSSIEDMVIALG